jgi:NAD(P)-dependent dehydrogenase (short-subunit alcohol dehydrogenase family)
LRPGPPQERTFVVSNSSPIVATASASTVWLITGASSGLGLALAQAALARGDRVLATARDLNSLAPLAAAFPATCRTFELDVTARADAAAAVAAAHAAFGRIDVVVSNAGSAVLGATEALDDDALQRNLEVNFLGPMRLIRAALPTLRAQRSGRIMVISAAAAIANYPGFAGYGGAKWALEGACESLAQEVRPLGIHVTLVQPGPFRTAFISKSVSFVAEAPADYEASCGKFLRFLRSMDTRQPGDPARAAEVLLALSALERPPLRLVLGRYAHDKAKRKAQAALRDLETALGADTDYPT